MSINESIRMALGSLYTNKMRSLLTLLGVIIGIAAVISILTLGHAVRGSIQEDLNRLGANNFNVSVVNRPNSLEEQDDFTYMGGPGPLDEADMITPEMLDGVKAVLGPQISGVIIGGESIHPVKIDGSRAFVQPTNPDFVTLSEYSIEAGRSLSEEDIKARRHVALLPVSLAVELFSSPGDAISKVITIEPESTGAVDLQIIGVFEKVKSSALTGNYETTELLVPYSLEAILSDESGSGNAFRSVSISANSDYDKQSVGTVLQKTFDAIYQDNPDFEIKIDDYSRELATFNETVTVISAVVAAIGGISLLVGGIGVMNIMLITVSERTREIGVRKALGARRRDIRLQFIVEAVVVCMVGGIIGVILGSAGGMVGAVLAGGFVFPPWYAIVIAMGFSLVIGVSFGYYPAGKAAKLDPIEALRYE
ncbi:ABC transporter permease [Corynebacterium phocae]|uniref:ABC transporter permease n=1 Tax=Corynebacterium phocae TaxID=161895 RepID=A0A1L7D559_9CORY|nr:ABC transporter permease [Corynebacterium phocae]APT93181.1 ABC transporter permease [Corynebacterium phocae]KAA8721916.1 FtsX-like permease family protein [Corynebacterium phocae]